MCLSRRCPYLCSCLSSVCLSLNTSFVRILVSSFLDPRVPWQPYIAELPYFFLNNLKIWWGKTIAFLHLADMMLKWGIHKRSILRRKCKDSNFMRLIKGYRSRCITMFLSFHLLQWILSPFFSSPLVLFSGSKATENRSERCPVSRSRSPWGVHLHLRDRCDRNRERWHLLLSLVI